MDLLPQKRKFAEGLNSNGTSDRPIKQIDMSADKTSIYDFTDENAVATCSREFKNIKKNRRLPHKKHGVWIETDNAAAEIDERNRRAVLRNLNSEAKKSSQEHESQRELIWTQQHSPKRYCQLDECNKQKEEQFKVLMTVAHANVQNNDNFNGEFEASMQDHGSQRSLVLMQQNTLEHRCERNENIKVDKLLDKTVAGTQADLEDDFERVKTSLSGYTSQSISSEQKSPRRHCPQYENSTLSDYSESVGDFSEDDDFESKNFEGDDFEDHNSEDNDFGHEYEVSTREENLTERLCQRNTNNKLPSQLDETVAAIDMDTQGDNHVEDDFKEYLRGCKRQRKAETNASKRHCQRDEHYNLNEHLEEPAITANTQENEKLEDGSNELQNLEKKTKSSRKRLRNDHLTKIFLKKQSMEKGKEHFTPSGKLVRAKLFKSQVFCKCKKNCATKIDVLRQNEIFSTFYNLLDWSKKTLFIRENVSQTPVQCKKSDLQPIRPLKNRNNSRRYSLTDDTGCSHQVCRDFFIKCLQVSSSRIHGALKSIPSNPGAVERRGNAPSANKTPELDKKFLKAFIEKFPKYESHYGRSKTKKKYLSPNLNIIRMYREYKAVAEFRNRHILSEHMFREIFNKEYNLAFKRPKADTCKRCDEIDVQLEDTVLSFEAKSSLEKDKLEHLDMVRSTKTHFNSDYERANDSNGDIQMLTFDLQKTLETPCLSTSIAYYKRKLWTYNLCVYNEVERKAYMYVWTENVASRGGQEVASCLLYHFKNKLPSNTKHIIMYSDACGAQNRNIKVSLLIKKFLCSRSNRGIGQIDHKFFVSGHSYNACDRCFGLIEKQKKVTSEIYSPKHWMNLIAQSKKTDPKFEVIEMTTTDFFSSRQIEKIIVNRKKDIYGRPINWFQIRKIFYERDQIFKLNIEQDKGIKYQINLEKKNIKGQTFKDIKLKHLYKYGKKISKEKYADIQDLLKLIPKKHHAFYHRLEYNEGSESEDLDYGLASSDSDEGD